MHKQCDSVYLCKLLSTICERPATNRNDLAVVTSRLPHIILQDWIICHLNRCKKKLSQDAIFTIIIKYVVDMSREESEQVWSQNTALLFFTSKGSARPTWKEMCALTLPCFIVEWYHASKAGWRNSGLPHRFQWPAEASRKIFKSEIFSNSHSKY